MFSPITTVVALALLVVSGVFVRSHLRTWWAAKDAETDEKERRFAWLQFRRRVQASGMIGLAGIGIFVGQFIRAPLLLVFFWTGIVLLLLWIVLLAMADMLATQQHFGRQQRLDLAEEARLQAQFRARHAPSDPAADQDSST